MDLERAQHQPNAWTCGPAALRHGMLAIDPVDAPSILPLEIQSFTTCCQGNPNEGRCEHGLRMAAKVYGFALRHFFADTTGDAYEGLRTALEDGPVLLCVDHYAHWITALRATSRHVHIVDSSRGGELLQRLTWRKILIRLSYGLPEKPEFHYYPLVRS